MSATTSRRIYRAKARVHTPRVRIRKDGTLAHQVRYQITRDGTPSQTSKVFDDPTAAARFAKNIDTLGVDQAVKILEAQLKVAATATITIGPYLRSYVARLTGIEEETGKRYLRFIERDIEPFMGDVPVEAYDEDLDAAWVQYLETEVGNAGKTIRNKHGFMSQAMAAAARKRPTPLLPFNPCPYTRLPKAIGPELDFFTPREYELFDAVLAPQWRALFEFMVMSMCRPGEIFALKVGDIDRETGAVRITRAWKYAGGKLKLGPPKSARGVRTVYVPLSTIARLDLDRPRDAWLFATAKGTPLTVPDINKRMWGPALRRLESLTRNGYSEKGVHLFDKGLAHWTGQRPGQLLYAYGDILEGLLAKRLTPYTTRHTGISWRLQDGSPIWVVSRDAGHESQATTDRRYAHIDSRASLAAAELVAGRLPDLRRNVVDLDLARRQRLVRDGQLGEVYALADGFEAVWLSDKGIVESDVFDDYDAAIDHVARHETGDPIAA